MATPFEFQGHALVLLRCGTCAVTHAIPAIIYNTYEEEGGFWHCPNGHQRGFREGKHERERVRRERDRLLQDRARLSDEITQLHDKNQKLERKVAGQARRAAAGVCPCCSRSFVKLQMHMKSKHPQYGQLKAVAGGKT